MAGIIIIIKLFSFSMKDENTPIHVSLPVFPDSIKFAGENIPLSDSDVHERLDRELLINTFWHSQTILFFKRANKWFPTIEPILKKNIMQYEAYFSKTLGLAKDLVKFIFKTKIDRKSGIL